jgi:hypothetical protein
VRNQGADVSLYLLTLDLKRPFEQYRDLTQGIDECGQCWRAMEAIWFISSQWPAAQIVAHLNRLIRTDDLVFVSAVSEDASWSGFAPGASEWLRARAIGTNQDSTREARAL